MANAIVYTSNTGFTERYARLVGEKTGLPVYSLADAKRELKAGESVIYLGWLFASSIKGVRGALKRYAVSAVIAVGLCETGALLDEARSASKLPASIPLFTVQGGIKHSALRGLNKLMINMLTKHFAGKKNRSEDEEKMYKLLSEDGDYVSAEKLAAFFEYYDKASD